MGHYGLRNEFVIFELSFLESKLFWHWHLFFVILLHLSYFVLNSLLAVWFMFLKRDSFMACKKVSITLLMRHTSVLAKCYVCMCCWVCWYALGATLDVLFYCVFSHACLDFMHILCKSWKFICLPCRVTSMKECFERVFHTCFSHYLNVGAVRVQVKWRSHYFWLSACWTELHLWIIVLEVLFSAATWCSFNLHLTTTLKSTSS